MQIEIRCIDTDEQRGGPVPKMVIQPAPHTEQVRQVLQHLRQPHHRVHLFQADTTLRLHQRAGHAVETQLRSFSFQGLDECGCQLVTRDLIDRYTDKG